MRPFARFSHKDSNFRIRSDAFPVVTGEILRQRSLLESYVIRYPEFRDALIPVSIAPDAPEIVHRMANAASLVGVGPMAAVAGSIAQFAVEAAIRLGAEEAVVDNGGDLFLASPCPVTVGLYAGYGRLARALALQVVPGEMPVAVCSSSSRMGHSLSFGQCDLATVVATDAALADAAATHACNLVSRVEDIDDALATVMGIAGIRGVLIIKDDRVGLAGELPKLVRNHDPDGIQKVTRDRHAGPLPDAARPFPASAPSGPN